MFTSSLPGSPEAAFVKLNDPLANGDLISSLVAAGYIVRTRADADTVEARLGLTFRRDAALASGAQFVSTDYPEPDLDVGTGYVVDLPGHEIARCTTRLRLLDVRALTAAAASETAGAVPHGREIPDVGSVGTSAATPQTHQARSASGSHRGESRPSTG
jgi:hypothetical protein